MKIGAFIRCLVRPVLDIESTDDAFTVRTRREDGPGAGLILNYVASNAWPERAHRLRIGDVSFAWRGRAELPPCDQRGAS